MNTVTTFVIEQYTGLQYEAIHNGECETLQEARRCRASLERELGWQQLRIIERKTSGQFVRTIRVVE